MHTQRQGRNEQRIAILHAQKKKQFIYVYANLSLVKIR